MKLTIRVAEGISQGGNAGFRPGSPTKIFINKPEKEYARDPEIAKAVLSELGYPNTKIRWSAKAGCPCGCMPAFNCRISQLSGQDIFVDVA